MWLCRPVCPQQAGIAADALGAELVVLFNEMGTAVEGLVAMAVGPAMRLDCADVQVHRCTWYTAVCMPVQGQPTLTKAGIAAGALGAALVLLFNEVGTAVEVLGAVAVGQFAFRNLIFNKDRGEATKQVK